MRAEGHAVESICRVLREQGCQVAARTYRAWSSRAASSRPGPSATPMVVDAVRDIAWTTGRPRRRRVRKLTPEGLYGRRKMTALPAPHAHARGVCRVGRPGDAHPWAAGVRRDKGIRTTIPAKDGNRAGDLLDRDFTAAAPNRTWVTDFTYVRTWAGFVYVAFIVDVFAQRIVAWHAATTKQTDLVMTPLRMALWQRDREGHPIMRRRADPPRRRRVAIHLAAVHRAPRPRGHPALDRLRRRRLRQRPDGVASTASTRPSASAPPSSTTAPTRPSPTSSTPPPAGSTGTTTDGSTDPRQVTTSRVRASPLRCPQPRAATRIGAAENLGRFTTARRVRRERLRRRPARCQPELTPADRLPQAHVRREPRGR